MRKFFPGGYGSRVLNTMRKASKLQPSMVEFPLTPGRDFAGVVVDVGRLTRGLKVGDTVYGCPAPHCQGSHAEYVLAPSITVSAGDHQAFSFKFSPPDCLFFSPLVI